MEPRPLIVTGLIDTTRVTYLVSSHVIQTSNLLNKVETLFLQNSIVYMG